MKVIKHFLYLQTQLGQRVEVRVELEFVDPRHSHRVVLLSSLDRDRRVSVVLDSPPALVRILVKLVHVSDRLHSRCPPGPYIVFTEHRLFISLLLDLLLLVHHLQVFPRLNEINILKFIARNFDQSKVKGILLIFVLLRLFHHLL